MINTQPQPWPHAATAPPRPKQSTTPTHYKITPNNHGPRQTLLQITSTINDTNPGTIAALAQSVHPIVLKARAKKKARAMSHGIESPKAENVAANVSVLVSTEAPRSSRATTLRETGNGRQRDRLRFERRGLEFEGEEREPESEREEKRKK